MSFWESLTIAISSPAPLVPVVGHANKTDGRQTPHTIQLVQSSVTDKTLLRSQWENGGFEWESTAAMVAAAANSQTTAVKAGYIMYAGVSKAALFCH